MKHTLLKSLTLALSLTAVAPLSFGHGSTEPEYGGIVKLEHELAFELVKGENNTSIYIKDHGEPVDSSAFTGAITVLAAGKKSETPLVPAGGNKMTADMVLSDGDKGWLKYQPATTTPSLSDTAFKSELAI